MLPNHLIIGAIKSGTTTLATLLRQHPEVFVTDPKELHFFNREENYAKGIGWYESHFAGAEGRKVVMEATPNYSALRTHPETLDRIAAHLPQVRLIYIVREPIERIRSHWYFLYGTGVETKPFERALREEPIYLDASRYFEHTEAMRARLGADRLRVMFLDDFTADPAGEMARLCRWLGVDDRFEFENVDVPRNAMAAAGLFRRAARVPGFVPMKNAVPIRARRFIRERILKKIERRPPWPADLLSWVRQEIGPDTARFLAREGKPEGFWPAPGLAAAAS
ncbi:MAG: sulfotransferase [Planctomycetota bacterium]|nr:MAG: sulfotransferase [Planctomycetota bacterium]